MKLRLSLCVAAAFLAASAGLTAQPLNTDYRYPGGDAGATRYSPLTQINAKTVGRLKQAWRYDLKPDSELQNTPIVVDGVREAAWDALHEAPPARWSLGPSIYSPMDSE